MATGWTTKEKIVLMSDVLQFGDQPESWSSIANNLSRTFESTALCPQTKGVGRFSIKNCKVEYKRLVDRYNAEWLEYGSSNGLRLPLAKYVWMQLKSIYQAELTFQLTESRKKLTEFCLRVEAVVAKSTGVESTVLTPSIEPMRSFPITTEMNRQRQSTEESERTPPTLQPMFQPMEKPTRPVSDMSLIDLVESSSPATTNFASLFADASKRQNITPAPLLLPQPVDQSQIKQEPIMVNREKSPTAIIHREDKSRSPLLSLVTPSSQKRLVPAIEQLQPQQPPQIETSSSSPVIFFLDQQHPAPQAPVPIPPSLPTTGTSIPVSESTSSSRSTSRTSSETKMDIVKVLPSTTSKYCVYFSPKNSTNTTNITTNNNNGSSKKSKRKLTDDVKDDKSNDSELSTHQEPTTPTPSSATLAQTEQSNGPRPPTKPPTPPAVTAPVTRRSVNTRSIPNPTAEQEEERSRRFSAMLSENPHTWQSQAMAIIQFIIAHKQGYLFQHEITDEIAPKYHKFVRRAIALDTIRKTLESDRYPRKEYFKRDILLMLYNAIKYNPRHHRVHRSAKSLFDAVLPLFNLSSQEINGHATTVRSVLPSTTTTTTTTTTSAPQNDIPPAKRKRTK